MILRPSTLSSYPDCPRRSIASTQPNLIASQGYKPVELLPEIASIIGTSAHGVMESTLNTKIRTGELGSLKQGLEYGINLYEESTKDGVVWDAHASTHDQARFQITEIAKHYHNNVSPIVNPIQVEQELSGTIRDYQIVGHIDITEPTRCRDKKTGVYKPKSKAQLGAYSWLMHVNGHTVTDNPIVDWVPRRKNKYVMIEYDLKESLQSAKNVLNRMIDDIERFKISEDPAEFMANPMSQMCSNKLCPAHGTEFCKEWK